MGLKKRLRKIIPKEIRNNPLVAVVAVVALGPVALGAIGASTASIVGATVAANTATAIAIGTGVVTAGVTFAQTQDVSDSLKAGVRAGVGSAVGSAVSSSVTNAVAGQTGASIADLEPALRELPSQAGIGGSLAGAASITAGNVAGEAARAAVTGRPIEEGALLGLAGSIPQALAVAPEFNSLHPIVQNVVASSAQAAVRGQDIGDAALTALITSSKIVSRAINELPNGQQIIRDNPTFTKYVIDSVSSALAAQLQGKDVSESVIQRLVQTTAEVIGQEIENSTNAKQVQEANEKFRQAQQVEQETLAAQQQLNDLVSQNRTDVNNYNYYKDRYNYVYKDLYQRYDRRATEAANSAQRMRDDPFWMFYEGQFGRTPEYYDQIAEQNRQQRDVFIGDVNEAVAGLNQSYEKLQAVNFFDEYKTLNDNFKRLNSQLTALTNDIQIASQNLANASANLFTDFETELATTIAPLTAFEDVTDVGDQDVLAEIQPVAPPENLLAGGNFNQVPIVNSQIAQEIQSKQQEIENINKEAMKMALAGVDIAAFPALAVSIGGHAALAAYIWLSQKYNELFPDPETAKIALEQSPQAQQFVTIVKMELNKTPEVKITTNPVTQKREAKVTIPDTPENPLLKETKEFIERIEAQIKSPSEEAKFNADNIYDELVKIFGEKGVAGEGANDFQTDLEGLEQEANLIEEGVTSTTIVPSESGQQVLIDTLLPKPQKTNVGQIGGEGGLSDDEIIAIIKEEADLPIQKPVDEDLGAGQGAGGGEQPVVLPPIEVSLNEPTQPSELDTGTPPTDIVEPPIGGEVGEEGPIQPGEGEGEEGEGEGAIPIGDEGIGDKDLLDLIRDELFGPGAGEKEGEGTEEEGEGPGAGEEGEGTGKGEEGTGEGDGLVEGGVEGEGDGAGVGGEGGKGTTPSPDILLPTARVTTVGRRTFQRPGEAAPYRVTGMDESGILGRKQPLFGGDEDLQRAEWNRRSLRLRRLLGL